MALPDEDVDEQGVLLAVAGVVDHAAAPVGGVILPSAARIAAVQLAERGGDVLGGKLNRPAVVAVPGVFAREGELGAAEVHVLAEVRAFDLTGTREASVEIDTAIRMVTLAHDAVHNDVVGDDGIALASEDELAVSFCDGRVEDRLVIAAGGDGDRARAEGPLVDDHKALQLRHVDLGVGGETPFHHDASHELDLRAGGNLHRRPSRADHVGVESVPPHLLVGIGRIAEDIPAVGVGFRQRGDDAAAKGGKTSENGNHKTYFFHEAFPCLFK